MNYVPIVVATDLEEHFSVLKNTFVYIVYVQVIGVWSEVGGEKQMEFGTISVYVMRDLSNVKPWTRIAELGQDEHLWLKSIYIFKENDQLFR